MSERVEFRENAVPLEGVERSIEEVLELFGATVTSREGSEIQFRLPQSRGVAAVGGVACAIRWNAEDAANGSLVLSAGKEIAAPKFQQVAFLGAGAIGAVLGLLWPFFPELGTVSGIGVIVAFATYFMTLRRTPGGVAADILRRIVDRQRETVEG